MLLLASGCGGGDDSDSSRRSSSTSAGSAAAALDPAKQDVVRKADAICAETQKKSQRALDRVARGAAG